MPHTQTHVPTFEQTVERSHEWLREIREAASLPDEQQAYVALRGVMHALRDRLTVDEAAHLSAQLPMLIRGVYFEGWKPAKTPTREHREEFLTSVRTAMGRDDIDPAQAARATFRAIGHHVTEGEVDDVRNMLPSDIRELWPDGG